MKLVAMLMPLTDINISTLVSVAMPIPKANNCYLYAYRKNDVLWFFACKKQRWLHDNVLFSNCEFVFHTSNQIFTFFFIISS